MDILQTVKKYVSIMNSYTTTFNYIKQKFSLAARVQTAYQS
jgi:hypothetical protein